MLISSAKYKKPVEIKTHKVDFSQGRESMIMVPQNSTGFSRRHSQGYHDDDFEP